MALNEVKSKQEDWVSPQQLKKEWRKREILRAFILLLSSHLLSFVIFHSPDEPPDSTMPVEKGHILVQFPAKTLIKSVAVGKNAVSLFSEQGNFLSHAYLNSAHSQLSSEEQQMILLEIPDTQLAKILQWKKSGIVVTPKSKKHFNKKRKVIYEINF